MVASPLIDVREAAELAHVSRGKLWRWLSSGALACARPRLVKRKWYLVRARFLAWLE